MKLGEDSVRREHTSIIKALTALEDTASSETPTDIEKLSAARWALTREIMLHFSHMAALYTSCAVGSRVEYRCVREHRAMLHLIGEFQEHALRWHGDPRSQWDAYRIALRVLIDKVYDRILAEGDFITAYFQEHPEPVEVSAQAGQVASKAWPIRDLIFDEENRPIR